MVQVDDVDGRDGGVGVGVRGEQHPAGAGKQVEGLFEELHAAHLGHALVGEDHRDLFAAQGDLAQGLEGGGPRIGPHDAVVLAVLAAQVAGHGARDTGIVVDGQDHRAGHQHDSIRRRRRGRVSRSSRPPSHRPRRPPPPPESPPPAGVRGAARPRGVPGPDVGGIAAPARGARPVVGRPDPALDGVAAQATKVAAAGESSSGTRADALRGSRPRPCDTSTSCSVGAASVLAARLDPAHDRAVGAGSRRLGGPRGPSRRGHRPGGTRGPAAARPVPAEPVPSEPVPARRLRTRTRRCSPRSMPSRNPYPGWRAGPVRDLGGRSGGHPPAPWGQQRLRFTDAWRFTRGAGQTVAVIDTGVSRHPRLAGRLDDGGDLVGTDGGLLDCDGHGTLVAGVIGAAPDPTTGFVGVARTPASSRSGSQAPPRCPRRRRTAREQSAAATSRPSPSRSCTPPASAPASSTSPRRPASRPPPRRPRSPAYGRRCASPSTTTPWWSRRPATPNPGRAPRARTARAPARWWRRPGSATTSCRWATRGATGCRPRRACAGHGARCPHPGPRSSPSTRRAPASSTPSSRSGARRRSPSRGQGFAAPYVGGVVALVRARYPGLDARQVMARVVSSATRPDGGRDDAVGAGTVDPVAAVADVRPAEFRADAAVPSSPVQAGRVDLADGRDAHSGARTVALAGSAGAVVLLGGLGLTVLVARRARRPRCTRDPRAHRRRRPTDADRAGSSTVALTLAQTDATLGDVDRNLKRVERVLSDAVEADSDLVVFPELALSGYQVGDVPHDLSLAPDDPRLLRLSQQASGAGVLLGFPEAGGHGLHTYNSAGYYEDGHLVHVHRKLYLPTYSTFEERKHFLPGQHSRAYGVRGGRHRAATLICNDAWQPQVAFLSDPGRGAHPARARQREAQCDVAGALRLEGVLAQHHARSTAASTSCRGVREPRRRRGQADVLGRRARRRPVGRGRRRVRRGGRRRGDVHRSTSTSPTCAAAAGTSRWCARPGSACCVARSTASSTRVATSS